MKDIIAKTDTSKSYLLPMCKIGDEYGEQLPVKIHVIDMHDGTLKCIPDNTDEYECVYLVDDYFQWLMYRKQIKEWTPDLDELPGQVMFSQMVG